MQTLNDKQKQIVRNFYFSELSCFHQTHKMLMGVHYFGGVYFLGRFQNLTDDHIQIAKEVLLDQVSLRIFGGTEVMFSDEESQKWFTNMDINYFESYHKQKYDWNSRTSSLDTSTLHWKMKQEYLEKFPKCIFQLES